jgi:hypothetical protein
MMGAIGVCHDAAGEGGRKQFCQAWAQFGAPFVKRAAPR